MTSSRLVGVSCVAALLFASVAVAQDRPSEYLETVTLTVRPGSIGAFEDYVKKIVEAAEKVRPTQRWAMFQNTLGGPGRTYIVALYFNKWGEIDGWTQVPQLLTQAYGEREGTRILQTGSAAIESSETAVYRLLPDHSTKINQAGKLAPHYSVIVTQVKLTESADYESFLEKLAKAQEQMAGVPPHIRRVSVMGSQALYVTSRPMEKFADMDGWEAAGGALQKMYGDEEARRILEMGQRAVISRNFSAVMLRPDLSYGGPPPPTSE